MATQTARYYSEGGRATKRQKTDNDGGMATVSNKHVRGISNTSFSLSFSFLSESSARVASSRVSGARASCTALLARLAQAKTSLFLRKLRALCSVALGII